MAVRAAVRSLPRQWTRQNTGADLRVDSEHDVKSSAAGAAGEKPETSQKTAGLATSKRTIGIHFPLQQVNAS